ncbi:hypothetical protein NBRC116583_07960 [Arenicella sp. 4NH20-0111]|uniref:hypothetical protein n=1 Tax=Arenicella sp. 4NH20-0111 TaxID=3127648 RepID=UPI003104136A
MNPAIDKLAEYLSELEGVSEFETIEEKAKHIGNINLVINAISQLELCDKHGINGGSLVSVLPKIENPNFCYVVAHENESTNPENWVEVEFEKGKIQFSGGDLVIRK